MTNLCDDVSGASGGLRGDSAVHLVGAAVFDLSTIALLVIDDTEQICSANAAAAGTFGADALDGRALSEVFSPDHELQYRRGLASLLAGDVNSLECSGVIGTDSGCRVQVSLRIDPAGSTTEHRLFLVQVDELPSVNDHEIALTRGESDYQQLVSTVPGMSVLMFDRDLRLLRAGGEVLARSPYDADTMPGQLMAEVFPESVMSLVERRFRAAFDGQKADFDYDSPVDGRPYRIRIRPVVNNDGTINIGLAVSEDVTADRDRQTLLEQMQQLSNVGTLAYDLANGWHADDKLLALLGLDSSQEALQAIDSLVLPEDRGPTRAAYRSVLSTGGRTTRQYRLTHGKTGELRHVLGAFQVVVDADGNLLRALATHADVTEAVQAQAAKVAAAQARTLLLRSVSDAFTKAPGSLRAMMQSTVDIITAVLGDSTVLRVFTADATGVEADLVSDSDEPAEQAMISSLRHSAHAFDSNSVTWDAAGAAGALLSSIKDPAGRGSFERRLACPVVKPAHHFISAAVRHDGLTLGYLHVFRTDPDKPYQDGDDHLIQVLADRIGTAIAESRVRELLELQRAERSADAIRLHELTVEHRELLEQLSGVEDRERILLAEAIHDGPMQLVVAVMMNLLNLQMAKAPIGDDALDSSINTLETSILNLRTLIIALTPPDLSHGLGVALRQLAQGIFMGTTTEISILGLAHVHLTPLSKGNAHRILREALVNARKHAQARHVVLELTESGNTVVARLTDDGVGATTFDAGPGHLGMATMRARADAEGGTLEISCSPGTGTTVVLTLPMAARDALPAAAWNEGPQ